jgi:signal peptidase II
VTPRKAFLLVLTLGLLWTAADQWTKYMAVRDLTVLFERQGGESLGERVRLFYGTHGLYPYAKAPTQIIPGVWNHVYVQNPAGAFGLLSGASETVRRVVFTGVAILAAIGILWMARQNYGKGMLPTQLGLALVFGGALGNLIDRVVHGYVIDFIDWYVVIGGKARHWPAFNLADVGIVVGVFGLFFLLNFGRQPASEADDKKPEVEEAEAG